MTITARWAVPLAKGTLPFAKAAVAFATAAGDQTKSSRHFAKANAAVARGTVH